MGQVRVTCRTFLPLHRFFSFSFLSSSFFFLFLFFAFFFTYFIYFYFVLHFGSVSFFSLNLLSCKISILDLKCSLPTAFQPKISKKNFNPFKAASIYYGMYIGRTPSNIVLFESLDLKSNKDQNCHNLNWNFLTTESSAEAALAAPNYQSERIEPFLYYQYLKRQQNQDNGLIKNLSLSVPTCFQRHCIHLKQSYFQFNRKNQTSLVNSFLYCTAS